MRTAKAIMQRNLQVGSYAPVTIRAAESQGATARAVEQLGLSRISLAGADATPEQLIDLAEMPAPPEPSEEERAREYAAFTDGKVSDDERTVELEDYREGLYPSWTRPGYVDWKHEAD